MAITSSAKKAIRASKKKALFNARRKKAIIKEEHSVKMLLKAGKGKDAVAALPAAYKAIDKAAKTHFIKKNTADRMKSRLTLLVNKSLAR